MLHFLYVCEQATFHFVCICVADSSTAGAMFVITAAWQIIMACGPSTCIHMHTEMQLLVMWLLRFRFFIN